MKNILLLITMLTSIATYSQKRHGTITLTDGTVLTGLVKVTSSAFKYKENETAEAVTYDYKTAVAASVINKDNEETQYEFVPVDYRDKPKLLPIIKNGFLKLYGEYNDGGGQFIHATFHVRKSNEKLGQYFVAVGYIPKVGFLKVIKNYFADCPALQQKIYKGELDSEDYMKIVDFYNEHCAPK